MAALRAPILPMAKPVKILFWLLLALIVVVLAAVAFVATMVDPNDYKPQITRLVQDKYQRSIDIPGTIRLTLFPRIGADLGEVRLSGHGDQSDFASIESARVSLQLLPLLSRAAVVDQIHIKGLTLALKRNADGSTNIDDLLPASAETPGEPQPQAEPGRSFQLDIRSLHVADARIALDDMAQKRKLSLTINKLDLEQAAGASSRFALDAGLSADAPALELKLTLESQLSQLSAALASGDVAMQNTQGKIVGQWEGQPFEARIELPAFAMQGETLSGQNLQLQVLQDGAQRRLQVAAAIPALSGTRSAFVIDDFALDLELRQDQLDAKLALGASLSGNLDTMQVRSPLATVKLSGTHAGTILAGKLATPLVWDGPSEQLRLEKIDADLNLPNPAGGSLGMQAQGRADLDLAQQTADIALSGKLDDSQYQAKLQLAGFSKPGYRFDVGIDQLDLDRYRAAPPATTGAKPGPPSAPATASTAGANMPATSAPKASGLDLSALQHLKADGQLRINKLKVANIHSENVRVELRAADGNLAVPSLQAALYRGSVSGSLSASASKSPKISVKQKFSGIDLGPLLRDAMGQSRIEGRGNVSLDLSGSGADIDQIKRSLNGSASLSLRDGALRGLNLAQLIRQAQSHIAALQGKQSTQGSQEGTGSNTEKTDFSEMSASFRIAAGVAHNQDLDVKSPLLRVGGAGSVDLGQETLDYTVKASVVPTLKGQDGAGLEKLTGVTVPIRLSGPLDAIKWRLDLQGLVTGLAQQQIDRQKEQLQQKADKLLEQQKDKLGDKLGEKLKGLFGR